MKVLGPRIVLAAGSLALALLGLEASLRVAGYAPLERTLTRTRLVRTSSVPGRVYELVPGAHGEGWGARVEVNALGFRGPEPAPAESGHERIVALGDSVTFGNDLPYEHTWPAVLEHELRGQGLAVDVLDLALGGYDTMQELSTLEDIGLPLQPSRVVLGYCVNDVGIVSMSMETTFVDSDRQKLLYRSRIAQWFAVSWMERAHRRELFELNREPNYEASFAHEIDPLEPWIETRVADLAALLGPGSDAEADLGARRIPPRWYASEIRIGRLWHAFGRLASLSQRHGFEVTVLLIPYLAQDPGIERGLDLVGAMAEARGFRTVDPRPAFGKVSAETLRIRAQDPVHPNARGHVLLARALAPALLGGWAD